MASMEDTAPRTRVEATVHAIRRDIIDGSLAPGSKLAVDHLRQRYGVGSSTIREALSHLVPDGLVTAQGQRGYAVAPISLDDLLDIGETRAVLEAQAIRTSIECGDDEWEANIVAAFHRLTKAQQAVDAGEPGAAEEWEQRNRAFHGSLTAACSSRWIHWMLDMLHYHSERYRRIALRANSVPRDVHSEHRELMDAVLARDADRATDLITSHLLRTSEVISELYDDQIPKTGADDAA